MKKLFMITCPWGTYLLYLLKDRLVFYLYKNIFFLSIPNLSQLSYCSLKHPVLIEFEVNLRSHIVAASSTTVFAFLLYLFCF